ncbi:MAG: FMN-binding glutamate synthase family protein [Thermofilum sp. ex4484_15]|nr:MAG: FMN-binding glutamate synthase family protein [Thermofilum sp. ex4484_15]
MPLDIYANKKSTTGTATRVQDVSPLSGLCPICIEECPVLCEIGLSALRGKEALYPIPDYFGASTASSNKDYGLDWSHFNIQAELRGARGIAEDPDLAIFPNVSVETKIGGIKLRIPFLIAALGSTKVAKKNWDSLAIGAAISGTIMTVGENVVGMDPDARFDERGKVTDSADLKYRIETYRKFWDGEHGDIVVQTNVEDMRLGVDEYALSKLEVNGIERKWGQGAKAIGGEVRLFDLDKAIMYKKRGYIIIPDPEDPAVQEAYRDGIIRSFERHSRVGMPKARDFVEDVEWLRERGAKYVTIKTGAYRPAVVAWTLKVASEARVNYVTFDGAGGGTGMSPVPMMQEMGLPTVYLEAIVLKVVRVMRSKGMYVPDIAMAGGFSNETQVFKAIALSNFGEGPYVRAIAMARAPLTAVFKATYFAKLAKEGKLPSLIARKYGNDPTKLFAVLPELKAKFKDRLSEIPYGAIGLYSYFDKMRYGLQQLIAGCRKWKLELIDRKDLMALTERASKVTGIPLVEECDKDEIEEILGR